MERNLLLFTGEFEMKMKALVHIIAPLLSISNLVFGSNFSQSNINPRAFDFHLHIEIRNSSYTILHQEIGNLQSTPV